MFIKIAILDPIAFSVECLEYYRSMSQSNSQNRGIADFGGRDPRGYQAKLRRAATEPSHYVNKGYLKLYIVRGRDFLEIIFRTGCTGCTG